MTDTHGASGAPAPAHPVEPSEFDHELSIRGILWATGAVIAVTLLAVISMWGALKGLASFEHTHAGVAPPMMSGHETPAGPLLQASPPADMDAMKAGDDNLMGHAAWVDRAQGTVRLPIDVAIDVLAEQGLPKVTTPTLHDMMTHGSYADDGRPPTDQPSPGTLLPPPGMGISSIGPPSAGSGQQIGAAMPGPPVAMPGASPAAAAPAAKPAAPRVAPIIAPRPPGGRP